MEIRYRNFMFDTDGMRAFDTGVESMPTIFVNENGLCFLQRHRRGWTKPVLMHLRRSEAMRYSETFRLDELRVFLAQARTPKEIGQ